MAVKTGSSIVPSYPDIKVAPAGRYGGVLLGMKTATERGDVNRKYGIAERELKMKEEYYKSKTGAALTMKDVVSLYNKKRDEISKINAEKVKNSSDTDEYGESTLEKMPSFNNFVAEITGSVGGAMMGGPADVSAPAMPSGGGALMGMGGPSQVPPAAPSAGAMPGAPQAPGAMMPGGQQGGNFMQRMGGNIQQVLQQLLGSPQGSAQAPNVAQGTQLGGGTSPSLQAGGAEGASSLTTEDLLQALDDYDDVNMAIEDIVALDNMFNQAGLELGPNVDTQMVLEAFRKKFGEGAVDQLMARIQ